MRTRITSYGPHDGIIVCCGIQQEPRLLWPLNDHSSSPNIQPFHEAPKFTTAHCSTVVDESGDSRKRKNASSKSNQSYQLTANDSTSRDNFNAFEKVHLNIFETNPAIAKIRPSFRVAPTSDSNYKSDSNSRIRISSGDASHTRKLATTMQNDHCRRDVEKTTTNDSSNHNMRLESAVNFGRDDGPTSSITRLNSNAIQMKESFKKTTTTSYDHYNDHHRNDEATKYDYNQIEKEFANDSSLRSIPSMTTDRKIIDKCTNGQGTSSKECRFLEHLVSSSARSSNHQQRLCRNWPDLREVQRNHRNVPEQLYHLYETQDAFGNLMEQL
ncbi:unnamed protein product [Litomosoides sigmodontis]|uniref:Uncharacterized protein n=1 Tax=Litomosoides sigmodontis TaxID=42156 RepID=A0A3P6UHZ3_LITSI|nr:unnamed protein product [Litomosoides sigmodontis]VDK79128.1 unnamed protein product [Litomosoides sigmodontis]